MNVPTWLRLGQPAYFRLLFSIEAPVGALLSRFPTQVSMRPANSRQEVSAVDSFYVQKLSMVVDSFRISHARYVLLSTERCTADTISVCVVLWSI